MRKLSLLTIIIISVMFLFNKIVMARVRGVCSNCHTMHTSQNGTALGPTKEYLLVQDCVTCHSSATNSTYKELGECKVPVVLYTGGEPTSYLAGGNFYWVKEDLGGNDTKGHNVFLNEDDDYLSYAPGWATVRPGGCGSNSCHDNLSRPYEDDTWGLKGKYGCQGCHLHVKHHANDHPNGESGLVTSAEQGWYRFLSGHAFTGKGVKGYEHGLWEAGLHDGGDHRGASEHNEYLASPDSGVGFTWDGGAGDGVTAFCTGCHGQFHKETKSDGAWIRHPSDAIIPNEGEYQYVGGENHLYDPLTPVARPSVSDLNSNPAYVRPGKDYVMCLSCHRPHGSPYPDMLRWDYHAQEAGGGGEDRGCFYCHTQKN